MLKPATTIKSTLMAASLALSAFSLNAQAALTSYTVNGTDFVYSSISNVSYTKDANLLGTMMANSTDADGNGTLDVIDAIVAASQGVSYDTNCNSYTCHTLTAADFNTMNPGATNWYGSMAFVTYLNTINYGGSNSWYLPTITIDLAASGSRIIYPSYPYYAASSTRDRTIKGDELIELNVDELNYSEPPVDLFINFAYDAYWTGSVQGTLGTGNKFDPAYVQYWNSVIGEFKVDSPGSGSIWGFTWAVTQGMVSESTVSAVPAPAAAWLFATGLPVVGAFVRRRKQQA